MFKASLDRGQAPDFEIKLSVVSSKFIRDEAEIRFSQLASSARAFCYAWTEAFISLCPEKWMTWWRACCLASVVPQFGSTGMVGEVQSLKLPSSPRRYALKVSQNAHTIRTHSVEPNCKRQEIPSKCVTRRWNAVCKQWILSVVHLSSFLDAIIADLGTFLWFSGCSRRPWCVWHIDRWESPATHPFAPYRIPYPSLEEAGSFAFDWDWYGWICFTLLTQDLLESKRTEHMWLVIWLSHCQIKTVLPPERSPPIVFSAHLYSRSSCFWQIRVSVYNPICMYIYIYIRQ